MTKAIKYEPAIFPLDFSRGSSGTYFDNLGVLQTAGVDEARLTHDPDTLEAQGLLIEEQRTNLWTDSSGNDATVGVIGSGGALPSGWAVEAGSGLSVEVLQNDINADLGGCRLRISGTADGNLFRLRVSQGNTKGAGVTVTGSNHIKGVSGNLSGISGFRLTLVNTSMAETFFDPFNFDKLTTARHVQTGAPPETLLIRHEIRFSTTNGIGVDITLDIGGAQLEQGAFPTSYIKTEGSQVTRSDDNCSRTLGSEFNASEGTVVAAVSFPEDEQATLFALGRAVDLRMQVRRDSVALGNKIRFIIIDDVATIYNDTPFTQTYLADSKAKVAISYSNNNIVLSVDGQSASQSVTLGVWEAELLSVGARVFGVDEKSVAKIENIQYYPRALSATELEELTA